MLAYNPLAFLLRFNARSWEAKLLFFAILAGVPEICNAQTSAASRPLLFFYPPPYQYLDGSHLSSPQTITVEQATSQVPNIPELSGIVLMVYWSTICPNEHKCDFSLIDKVIDYWAERQKKVILDVATIGYPILSPPNKNFIVSATPTWVLNKIATYNYPARVLGQSFTMPAENTILPDFRDKNFLLLVKELVYQLRKYDGNRSISQIRIATGLMGEDNPLVGPYSNTIPGYTEDMWISYCANILNLYEDVFHSTQLEFDIGRLSWTYVKEGDVSKKSVSEFVRRLAEEKVFLAFDGLGTGSFELLQKKFANTNGIARSLDYVRSFRADNKPAGLEAIGPLASNNMTDITGIIKTVSIVHPDHVVLFYDFPALIDYIRHGLTDQNKTAIQSFSKAQLSELKINAVKLLDGLGY